MKVLKMMEVTEAWQCSMKVVKMMRWWWLMKVFKMNGDNGV